MTPTTIVYALLAGVLPALLWLWFWLKEDNLHPEPRKLIAFCFIAGGISVIGAIIFEKMVQESLMDPTLRYIAWAAIEEILKFLVVALIAFRTNFIDEPIDSMVYCVTAALGFAALENALFILSPLSMGQVTTTLVTSNLRFIGATLVHLVSSATVGFAIGLCFYRSAFVKTVAAFFGLILAVTLHASFNLAIINGTATSTLKVFGWVWCAVIILIILFEEIKSVRPKSRIETSEKESLEKSEEIYYQ